MSDHDSEFGKAVVRPVLLVVFVFVQVFLIAVPRHDTLDLEAWPNTELSPRISGVRTVGQSFVPGRNGLGRVDVFLATYAAAVPGDVMFRLYEGDPAGTPLAEVRVPGSAIRDNLFNPFEFRRIRRSKGRRFSFTLSAPGLEEGQGPSVWMNPADLFPKGALLIDGLPAPGDGVFRTYSRRTILSEWGRISRGAPGFLGHPFVLAAAAVLFLIASTTAFWHILGLFLKRGKPRNA